MYLLFLSSSSLVSFNNIFLSHFSGELKRLKNLVIDSKKENIKVVSALVNSMLERNMFLFGSVDLNEGSVTERVNELTDIENAFVRVAQKKYIF